MTTHSSPKLYPHVKLTPNVIVFFVFVFSQLQAIGEQMIHLPPPIVVETEKFEVPLISDAATTPENKERIAKQSAEWGCSFNKFGGHDQCTANNLAFRFIAAKENGKAINIGMIKGIYYSQVRNFQPYPNDVVIVVSLKTKDDVTIVSTKFSFSRDKAGPGDQQGGNNLIPLPPAQEVDIPVPIYSNPIESADHMEVLLRYILRGTDHATDGYTDGAMLDQDGKPYVFR